MLLGTPPEASLIPPQTCPGRVVRVDRGWYDVVTSDGDVRVRALPPPRTAVVGDWLALPDDGELVVADVLPRRSLLARGSASGTSTLQPIAANVDVVVICVGLHGDLRMRRLERLLALVWDSGATPVVALTKADLAPDPGAVVRRVQPAAPGAAVVAVSAGTGDVDALRPWLSPGTTVTLLGASGAGKSTLLNALAGTDVAAVGAVRDVDGKGRHTTTHRELYALPGGAVVIDTPGLRAVALHDAQEGLTQAFADVEELATACRFADCQHAGEPGCAVAASIEAGDLAQERLDSWRKLQREAAFHARRTDARLRAEEKSRWKAVHRQQRARGHRP